MLICYTFLYQCEHIFQHFTTGVVTLYMKKVSTDEVIVKWNELLYSKYRVRNLKFARNLKFTTSKTLVNFMKKMMFLSKNWYFSVQKALIYYTVNKSHHNSFILLVFSPVANFRYVANFRFLTLIVV